jgi:hypothetical protein
MVPESISAWLAFGKIPRPARNSVDSSACYALCTAVHFCPNHSNRPRRGPYLLSAELTPARPYDRWGFFSGLRVVNGRKGANKT